MDIINLMKNLEELNEFERILWSGKNISHIPTSPCMEYFPENRSDLSSIVKICKKKILPTM